MNFIQRIRAPKARSGMACAAFAVLGLTVPAAAAELSNDLTVTGNARPDVFGTVTLPARADRFQARWNHASARARPSAALDRLVAPARGRDALSQLGYVQSTVNRMIKWRSDATQYGEQDYWARADETLASKLGDNEDLAIVKLQALKALGFRSSDLYLTMGRDAVQGPSHAVLLVRTNGRFYALDDTGDRPVATDQKGGFTPMITFGSSATWVHGKRFGGSAVAQGGE